MVTYIKNKDTVQKAEYLLHSFGEEEWNKIIEENILRVFPSFDEDKVEDDLITEMLESIIENLYNKHTKSKNAFKLFDILYYRMN